MSARLPHSPRALPAPARDYLANRLDGARDLYLVALALGERLDPASAFGTLIREARIHFASVIEEARVAGLATEAIAGMLGDQDLGGSIRPELWSRVHQLLVEARRKDLAPSTR